MRLAHIARWPCITHHIISLRACDELRAPIANWLTYRVLRSAVLKERGGHVRLRQRLVLLLMVPRHLPVPRRGMRESSSPYYIHVNVLLAG